MVGPIRGPKFYTKSLFKLQNNMSCNFNTHLIIRKCTVTVQPSTCILRPVISSEVSIYIFYPFVGNYKSVLDRLMGTIRHMNLVFVSRS